MMSKEVRVATPLTPRKEPIPLSRRFYRISGIVLLVLFAILIVLLLLKP
jgi:DNA-binding helix-hairpin-helix protein with protein kinase domain